MTDVDLLTRQLVVAQDQLSYVGQCDFKTKKEKLVRHIKGHIRYIFKVPLHSR